MNEKTNKIIQNKLVYILGKPGKGKTFCAVFVASFYNRIYSNFEILKNGRKINKDIKTIKDATEIDYNDEKWIIVLDELGINNNSRRSMTNDNMELNELPMLSRKKNVDILYLAQLSFLGDKVFREMANFEFKMNSWFDGKDHLMFWADIYTRDEWKSFFHKSVLMDLMEFSVLTGVTYNSLEESRMTKKAKTFVLA